MVKSINMKTRLVSGCRSPAPVWNVDFVMDDRPPRAVVLLWLLFLSATMVKSGPSQRPLSPAIINLSRHSLALVLHPGSAAVPAFSMALNRDSIISVQMDEQDAESDSGSLQRIENGMWCSSPAFFKSEIKILFLITHLWITLTINNWLCNGYE